MFCYILVNRIQESVNITRALRISGQLELARRVNRNQDNGRQNGDNADDHENFDQCETFCFDDFHICLH
jgi:hypothetical protein